MQRFSLRTWKEGVSSETYRFEVGFSENKGKDELKVKLSLQQAVEALRVARC
jgi:hypothetical protein